MVASKGLDILHCLIIMSSSKSDFYGMWRLLILMNCSVDDRPRPCSPDYGICYSIFHDRAPSTLIQLPRLYRRPVSCHWIPSHFLPLALRPRLSSPPHLHMPVLVWARSISVHVIHSANPVECYLFLLVYSVSILRRSSAPSTPN